MGVIDKKCLWCDIEIGARNRKRWLKCYVPGQYEKFFCCEKHYRKWLVYINCIRVDISDRDIYENYKLTQECLNEYYGIYNISDALDYVNGRLKYVNYNLPVVDPLKEWLEKHSEKFVNIYNQV